MAAFFISLCLLATVVCAAQHKDEFTPKEVYTSTRLSIIQIAEHSFQHISYLQTDDFGNVPCNGLIVQSKNEAVVFDTPTNDSAAQELIQWIHTTLHCKINAIVPTHFHDDCLGGLNAFHQNKTPSYANNKTVEFASQHHVIVPQHGFKDSVILNVGNEKVVVTFFGEGHTKDNVVAYFPGDRIMFGGCLIKELDATKGYLGDANIAAWSSTVEKVKKAYSKVKIIVPGHGKPGDISLLDYTIKLFAQ